MARNNLIVCIIWISLCCSILAVLWVKQPTSQLFVCVQIITEKESRELGQAKIPPAHTYETWIVVEFPGNMQNIVNLWINEISTLITFCVYRLVSSMTFLFPFYLPLIFYNDYFIFMSTCWNTTDLFIFKSFHQHFKKIW